MTEAASTAPDSLRLFFALWPDDATRTALNRIGKWLHQHWGGRRMRADSLHLTLAFLGSTPVAHLDALTTAVDTVRVAAFDLILDQPGCWLHNHVGWLAPSQPPVQLGELVDGLNAALQSAGVQFDARSHVPHVTLLRNTSGGELPACEPVTWPARDFALVASRRSNDGAYYEVLQRWALRCGQGA